MQRDEIRLGQELVERHERDPVLCDEAGVGNRLVSQDAHAEHDGAERHFPTNPAQADEPQGAAAKGNASGLRSRG